MSWRANGTYYEACNCEAICPCRPQGDRPGGRSTHGICDFVLSWHIDSGRVDGIDVAGRSVVMVGTYDDEEPGSPWSVVLYVDDGCTPEQHETLSDLYLRRLGFAGAIGEVKAVRSATISLDHAPHSQQIDVDPYVTVRTREPVPHTERVSCGIPGHDHPGREIIADVLHVDDEDLAWEFRGRTGFATDFSYAG